MDKREPILLKDLPEPLRTFAYHNMSCSHVGDGTSEDNPLIYPEVIFSDWNELAQNLNTFLEAIKEDEDPWADRADKEHDDYTRSLE